MSLNNSIPYFNKLLIELLVISICQLEVRIKRKLEFNTELQNSTHSCTKNASLSENRLFMPQESWGLYQVMFSKEWVWRIWLLFTWQLRDSITTEWTHQWHGGHLEDQCRDPHAQHGSGYSWSLVFPRCHCLSCEVYFLDKKRERGRLKTSIA